MEGRWRRGKEGGSKLTMSSGTVPLRQGRHCFLRASRLQAVHACLDCALCVFWRCEKRGGGHDFAWAELGEATCTKGKQRMANTSPQTMANLLDTARVWRQCFLSFEKR